MPIWANIWDTVLFVYIVAVYETNIQLEMADAL